MITKLENPYENLTGGEWMRGNLHLHTRQSDGQRTPQEAIDEYARHGYGFLMFSDHEVFTSEEAYHQWNNRGLIMIPGVEIAGGPHLLHVDADRWVRPRPSRQEILNEIQEAYRKTGRGFAIVNHPNWEARFDHCSITQLREWIGYIGLEIYNGVIGRLDGSPYALDKWDLLLSDGRRVWGFANDDAHSATEAELGWNVAYVKERTRQGVVDALRAGRFYASTGVTLRSIQVDGTKIRLETENAHRIAAVCNVGARFAVVDAASIEVDVPGNARYVRFQCWGVGERMAWTQPFFRTDIDGRVTIQPWRVSRLVEGARLASANPEKAEKLATDEKNPMPEEHMLSGFLDLRVPIRNRQGLVYTISQIDAPIENCGLLYLGYDGPIRVWLNGQLIFDGPGANPAIRDSLTLKANFRRGPNQLIVALDSNGGKAWGLFPRLRFDA